MTEVVCVNEIWTGPPAEFTGTLIYDDFEGDFPGVALPAHSPKINTPGNAWITEFLAAGGVFRISPSGMTADAAAHLNHAGSGIDAGSPDVTVSCDILSGSPIASAAGICFRGTGDNNYYTFKWVADGALLRIMRQDPGELILAQSLITINPNTTYKFKVELLGSSIKAYLDGVLQFSIADTTFNGNRHGLYQLSVVASTTLWDNFQVFRA